MAGNDASFPIYQDGVGPTELEQAGCDLGDLLGTVGAGIPLVGTELVDVPVFQFSGQDDPGQPAAVFAESGIPRVAAMRTQPLDREVRP